MAIEISRDLLDLVQAEAVASPGREVCGLLLGRRDADGSAIITDVRPADNVAIDPGDSFEIDPAALFRALRAERGGAATLVGHYHSHPGGSAIPSARDAAAAMQPGRIWLILAGGVAAAWREEPGGPIEGAFVGVELVVGGGEAGCAC